jgi:uncharacterized protein YigE (DUF2233 family)
MKTLAAILSLFGVTPAADAASPCEDVTFDGASFTVCAIDPASEDVRLFLYDANGAPYTSFRAVEGALATRGEALGIAMNAGMYHPDRSPVGLFVQEGQEYGRLVTSAGPGNFGLLPNGVLCLDAGRAEIVESRAYEARSRSCRDATQSGPMLVIEGELHPRFLPASDSANIRNGAGVDPDGTLWFAISNEEVNFHTFARLFRDRLGTPNALYLDGSVSRLYDAISGRHDAGWPMGPIIGTVREAG